MEQLNNNEYNILVVEDDKEIRDGIEIFLKSQGYHVYKAADGVEGLQIIEKEQIHLAIVDIMMPRMDGVTMTIKLREHHEFPVIMLSAKSEETDKVIGLNIWCGRLCDKTVYAVRTHGKGKFPAASLYPFYGNGAEKRGRGKKLRHRRTGIK